MKWIKTSQQRAELYFYRTHGGSEVDLLIETSHGIIGVEIKSRSNVAAKDTRHLEELSKKLKKKWLGGLIVYNGNRLYKVPHSDIWALPSWRLLT